MACKLYLNKAIGDHTEMLNVLKHVGTLYASAFTLGYYLCLANKRLNNLKE